MYTLFSICKYLFVNSVYLNLFFGFPTLRITFDSLKRERDIRYYKKIYDEYIWISTR